MELESRLNLGEREQIKNQKQTSLSDFLNWLTIDLNDYTRADNYDLVSGQFMSVFYDSLW